MKIVNENNVEEIKLPGRYLKWLISPKFMGSKYNSVCVIRILAGETVRPAHSHPNGEEVIYILRGKGKVMVDGEVEKVEQGMAVLFPQNSVHMLKNTGNTEMKVICFYSPPSDISTYKFFDEVSFPSEEDGN